ncbi:MAG TPA: flavin-dependent oxidoreductase [Stellaceae bacterium]|nr:flavin-dependent oxidoreductase [Stellaceae bacterium]
MSIDTKIAIIGGGIAGLGLALNLKRRNIDCRVYETAPELKELGVGITLLPHATREIDALGLLDTIKSLAIENVESCFFNRFGQLLYKEPRGKLAGYSYPELGIHRGRLHMALYQAALAALGPERIVTDRHCVAVEQNDSGVTIRFRETSTGRDAPSIHAEAAIGCDGINSAVRKQFYPNETVAFAGINTWRGVTRRKPILTGRSYMRVGSIRTGKIVIYPIIDNVDEHGNQLINWMAEIQTQNLAKNDWNKSGKLDDFLPIYQGWKFDWLDVGELIQKSDTILEYPMVDKDPIARWTFGRITFAGDAAHPMYPRGSNGAAQALIDARTLADLFGRHSDTAQALAEYETRRRETTAKIVRTNREHPPDFINIRVEELTGDKPYDDLDKFITQDELKTLSDNYKRVAGFAVEDVG